MIVAVDLDGVICEENLTFSRSLARPMPGAIQGMTVLREAGHRLIVYTARTWAEYEMTKGWLGDNKVPHDELIMGKPIVDCFIDDRAIAFTTWPAALEKIAPHAKAGDILNDHNLHIIRKTAASFLHEIVHRTDIRGPVLDVGPMWSGSGVFKQYPEFYVEARGLFQAKEMAYQTLDIDPATGPDFVGDFTDGLQILPANRFGVVILNHCIEHMPRLFRVPAVLDHTLAPGGLAFIATPWNFRFHGPRPDCWRISDDGYSALVADTPSLEIIELKKNGVATQPLHPASIHCIVRKKAA